MGAIHQGTRVTQLIQVCLSAGDPRTHQREVRSLLKAARELHCDNLLVLTDNYEAEESAAWMSLSGTVRHRPLWKWLCERDDVSRPEVVDRLPPSSPSP